MVAMMNLKALMVALLGCSQFDNRPLKAAKFDARQSATTARNTENRLSDMDVPGIVPSESPGAKAPVFVLAGQSNASGRCGASELPTSARANTHGGVEFYMNWDIDSNFAKMSGGSSSDGEWLPLQPQHYSLSDRKCFGPEFGIAATLGPRLAAKDIKKAFIIKYALGSTNLHTNWNPDNIQTETEDMKAVARYPQFLEFCLRALAKLRTPDGQDPPVQTVFWYQGESDSGAAKHANAYVDNLKRLVTAIRRDLKSPQLQLVTTPIVWPNGKKTKAINRALLEDASSRIDKFTCLEPVDETKFDSSVQPASAGPGFAGHVTAAVSLDIGRRMGEAADLVA